MSERKKEFKYRTIKNPDDVERVMTDGGYRLQTWRKGKSRCPAYVSEKVYVSSYDGDKLVKHSIWFK